MRPLIIAHRGASNLAPENTLRRSGWPRSWVPTASSAMVQLTKDHKLVIAHDFFTDAHTGRQGRYLRYDL